MYFTLAALVASPFTWLNSTKIYVLKFASSSINVLKIMLKMLLIF